MGKWSVPILATVLAIGGISAASAAPADLRAPTAGSGILQLARYRDCPPGYKATSHGSCKLSNYARHHPYQQDDEYYSPPPAYGYRNPPPYGYRDPPPYGYRPQPPRYDDDY